MIIYSEILDQAFDSVDECLDAELKFKREQKEKEKAEAERKEALDEAYEKAIAACDEYLKLVGIEVKHCECDECDCEDDEEDWLDELLTKFFAM